MEASLRRREGRHALLHYVDVCANMLNCAPRSRCFIVEFSILTTRSARRKDRLRYKAKSQVVGTSLSNVPKGTCICLGLPFLYLEGTEMCSLLGVSEGASVITPVPRLLMIMVLALFNPISISGTWNTVWPWHGPFNYYLS